MRSVLVEAWVFAGLLGLLLIAFELAFRAGLTSALEGEARVSGQVGAIQGAVLGLLGLLLAFSFAAAGGRFLERQDLIVAEANAIGTAFLRADLLDEPHRTQLRTALRHYRDHRLRSSASIRYGLDASVLAEIERLHAEIWRAAMAGVADRPATMLGVLQPVNEVIDFHTTRIAAGRKHLPAPVLGLLIASSALAMAVIGYGCGTDRHRRGPLTVSLAILIASGLWITIDLDHPRAGFIELSDVPLADLELDAPPGSLPAP